MSLLGAMGDQPWGPGVQVPDQSSLRPEAAFISGVLSLHPQKLRCGSEGGITKFGRFCLKKQAEPAKRFGEGRKEKEPWKAGQGTKHTLWAAARVGFGESELNRSCKTIGWVSDNEDTSLVGARLV